MAGGEERSRKRPLGKLGGVLAAPLFLWLVALVVLPNLILLGYAFCDRDDLGQVVPRFSLEAFGRLVDPTYARILVRSLWLSAIATIACLGIGYPVGYFLGRAPERWRNKLLLLVMIPFWTSFLVRTYAWMILLRSEGLINALLQYTRIVSEPVDMLYTEGAVLVGLVYAYLPFTILPIYASAEKLDGALVEAAYDLGARPWRAFVHVILPLTRPGIVAGAMFVFIPSIGMFAIADLMGGGRVPLVGNVIQNQFGQGRNWPFGAALGVALLALFLALLAWARRGEGEEALHRWKDEPQALRSAETAMIELRDVSKSYGSVEAVRDVSLSIRAGEIVTLLGPSGSGKTTLLRMIAGFETIDSGSVWLDGKDVTRAPPYERDVRLVFQSYALFPHLSVVENVAFGLKMQGVAKAERTRRVREAIELVQIDGLEQRRPSELSGGQRQRVALARALVCRPKVLLLDEPLSALDAKLREAMQVELKKLQQKVGITFVFVTHDQESALVLSDRIAVVSEGKIEQEGSVADIYHRPRTAFVASFIGEANLLPARVLSRAGGMLRLGVAPGVEVLANDDPDHDPGEGATIAIRPEKINVERDEFEIDGTFVATVTDEIFRGPTAQLYLRTEGGLEIVVSVATRTGDWDAPSKGDRVRWWVHRDDVVVLR